MRVARWLAPLLLIFNFSTARASEPYFEFGAGMSKFYSGSDFFNGQIGGTTGFSITGNFMIAENFSDGGAFLQFHMGIKNTYVAGSDGTNVGVMNVIYPIIRLEMPRMYIGFGASPFVLRRVSEAALGIDFQRNAGDFALLAEIGFVWRVVPFFYLALEVGMQTVNTDAGLSPFPAATGTFQMRFMLGNGDAGGGASRSYDGWRYPFGIQF